MASDRNRRSTTFYPMMGFVGYIQTYQRAEDSVDDLNSDTKELFFLPDDITKGILKDDFSLDR